jgi:alpha-ketoglutarate-dependent taurine dioxygenase
VLDGGATRRDRHAMPISLRPLSHSLGAEVLGVNVGGTSTNAEFDQIHRAFLDHGILLFRDQKITREREQGSINPPIAQPVVRVHPETGGKALYVGDKASCLVGMTPEESKPLVYRHQWRQNDIVFWDNRCTMHIALGDHEEGEIRHLEHTAVKGTPSGYYLQ